MHALPQIKLNFQSSQQFSFQHLDEKENFKQEINIEMHKDDQSVENTQEEKQISAWCLANLSLTSALMLWKNNILTQTRSACEACQV